MAVTIIKVGKNEFAGHCKWCGCDFRYTEDEVNKIGDSAIVLKCVDHAIVCPFCRRTLDHHGEDGTSPWTVEGQVVRPSRTPMAILDKHPAPWMIAVPKESTGYCAGKTIVDAHGGHIAGGEVVETDEGGEIEAGVEITLEGAPGRLLLAAPELLAALKGVILEADRNTDRFMAAKALIARIEGGNG